MITQRERSRRGGLAQSAKKLAACRLNAIKAGQSRSEAKLAAARENGKRGGRPKRLRTLQEIVANEMKAFRQTYPDLFKG